VDLALTVLKRDRRGFRSDAPFDTPNRYAQRIGRKAEDLEARPERLVELAGEHNLWLGSVNPESETGRMKVDNVERTAHRVAWELARGALSANERVLTCETNPACVRVEHLRIGAPPNFRLPIEGMASQARMPWLSKVCFS
jgi:hypothetical protein